MVDFNATQSAIRAGYSPRTAPETGSRLLKSPYVQSEIAKRTASRSRRVGVNADRVLQELARVAFLDPTELIDMDTAEVLSTVSEDDRVAITGVKIRNGSTFTEREVKFADKLRALELLGKHLGMYNDNLNININPPTIIDDIPLPNPEIAGPAKTEETE